MKSKLQTVLEAAAVWDEEIDVRSYSVSPGVTCLGVCARSVGVLFAAVIARIGGDSDTGTLQTAFANMRTDSMGQSKIMYFPTVAYVGKGQS